MFICLLYSDLTTIIFVFLKLTDNLLMTNHFFTFFPSEFIRFSNKCRYVSLNFNTYFLILQVMSEDLIIVTRAVLLTTYA